MKTTKTPNPPSPDRNRGSANRTQSKKMNPWPAGIIAAFVVFAAGLAAFVVLASVHGQDLVRPDYYDAEMRYQLQRDMETRTANFADQIAVRFDAARASVVIGLPAVHARRNPSGRIQFYRPSDAALDRIVSVAVDAAGHQEVHAADLASGLWKIRVRWVVDGEEFFVDRSVIVTGRPS